MPTIGNQPGNFNTVFSGNIDSVVAGFPLTSKPIFALPMTEDPTDASLVYDVLDADGLVYATGDATSISVVPQITQQNLISTETIVPIPSSIPANDIGTRYQLRWTLTLASGRQNFYYESFVVLPSTQVGVLGAEDIVEIHGTVANPSIVLDSLYDNVQYTVYNDNDVAVPTVDADNVSTPIAMPEGYQYLASIDSNTVSGITPRLTPYSIVWSYWNNAAGSKKYQDSAYLYFVTPTIINASKDVLLTVNKAYISVGVAPNAEFLTSQVMTYLREGMDYFNSIDFITQFTMTKASGALRDMWITASCVKALRAQYLAEGEKTFDFGSQAVTLTVDKTQYFESLASAMESELQARIPKFKQQLTRNGITGGNGDIAGTRFPGRNSTGALAVTISPASNAGALIRAGIRLAP